MAEQMKFRSAIHGFNRTDVIRHIDFLNNSHDAKLNQLRTEIEELQAELAHARQLPAQNVHLEEELAELQQRLADTENALTAAQNRADEAEAACTAALQRVDDLEASLSIPQPDTSAAEVALAEEKQRNADLDAALSASQAHMAKLEAMVAAAQQQNVELEQALAAAQAAAAAVAVSPDNLAAQELAAYRRAERVERMALARARDIATQANGVLYDTTARVDEDAVELSGIFDQLATQFDLLRERMIASKSTLKDAVTAMHAIPTETDAD